MKLDSKVIQKIEKNLNSGIDSASSLSGGCISNAFKILTASGKKYFLKINETAGNDMFVKEAHGLTELKNANAIRTPEVINYDNEFILLEFIDSGRISRDMFENFGINFAKLHQFKGEYFGFFEDNYIGSNVQKNLSDDESKNNWIKFYFEKRILFQLKLAEKKGYATNDLIKAVSKLSDKINDIIGSSLEPPSLLHGDLWSGNFMIDDNGNACIIDPAVYYGHREADLAMTKLFGGFNSEFYEAYNEYYPLKEGFEYRENIYKLYHVLNHLNLFGSGYYSQAISLIKYYL